MSVLVIISTVVVFAMACGAIVLTVVFGAYFALSILSEILSLTAEICIVLKRIVDYIIEKLFI